MKTYKRPYTLMIRTLGQWESLMGGNYASVENAKRATRGVAIHPRRVWGVYECNAGQLVWRSDEVTDASSL